VDLTLHIDPNLLRLPERCVHFDQQNPCVSARKDLQFSSEQLHFRFQLGELLDKENHLSPALSNLYSDTNPVCQGLCKELHTLHP
jgi:hypothetical protein